MFKNFKMFFCFMNFYYCNDILNLIGELKKYILISEMKYEL